MKVGSLHENRRFSYENRNGGPLTRNGNPMFCHGNPHLIIEQYLLSYTLSMEVLFKCWEECPQTTTMTIMTPATIVPATMPFWQLCKMNQMTLLAMDYLFGCDHDLVARMHKSDMYLSISIYFKAIYFHICKTIYQQNLCINCFCFWKISKCELAKRKSQVFHKMWSTKLCVCVLFFFFSYIHFKLKISPSRKEKKRKILRKKIRFSVTWFLKHLLEERYTDWVIGNLSQFALMSNNLYYIE